MNTAILVCLIFAFGCEVLAAAQVGHPRVNLMALGLAFYFVTLIPGLIK